MHKPLIKARTIISDTAEVSQCPVARRWRVSSWQGGNEVELFSEEGIFPMKYELGFAALLFLTASAFGQMQPVKAPVKPARKVAQKKLSDDYAKSALLALKAIQRDASTPDVSGDTILVNRHTQEAIDAADVSGTTDYEKAMTVALNAVYIQKLMYNQKLELKTTLHEMDSDLVKYSSDLAALTHQQAAQRAAQEPEIQALSKRLDACFADFDTTLRARSAALPAACASDDDKK
ncbi:MAG: hypothetical protein WBD39_00090 [Candidatus Acidiferrales bacterium]